MYQYLIPIFFIFSFVIINLKKDDINDCCTRKKYISKTELDLLIDKKIEELNKIKKNL
jgi:hypothetical protein